MNKKIISSHCLQTWLLIMSIFLTACSNEESWERPADLSPYIPDYSVGTNGSWYVSGSIASFNLEPRIYADFEYWKLQVKSIEYYIDDELVQTDTKEPYSFIYTAVGLTQGKHKFIMKVRIKDLISGKETIINPTKEFEVTSDASSGSSGGLSTQASWSYSGKNVSFTINSVELTKTLSDNGWVINTVNYYLDDELIEITNEKPYGLHYTAKDLNRGNHYLKIIAKISNSTNRKETELATIHKVEVGPGMNFDVDYNQFVKPGEPLKATPYFLDKRSDSGCIIKSVTYWVDDEEVDTKISAPFELTYNLPSDDKKHKMDVSISYSDRSEKSRIYYMSFSDIQFMKPDTHEYIGRWKGTSNFFVGDIMECFAKIYRGENVSGTDNVKVYIGEKFIGDSSTFPFTIDYKFAQEDVGSHVLRFEWIGYDTSGNVIKRQTTICSGIIVSD